MRYFCTYFDRHYLARALVLYDSLKRNCGDFKLWMLCLDEESYAALAKLKLPEVSLLTLSELERDDPPLRQAKTNRSLLEYYFTCTPCLPLFILRREPAVDLITYLDSDLFLSRLQLSRIGFRKRSANGNGTGSIMSAGSLLDAMTMDYPVFTGGESDVLSGVTIGLKAIDSPTKSISMIGRLGSKMLSCCSTKGQILRLGMWETTS